MVAPFLPNYNCISIIPPSSFTPELIVTAACLDGIGGTFQDECFHAKFPDHILHDPNFNINVKELLA